MNLKKLIHVVIAVGIAYFVAPEQAALAGAIGCLGILDVVDVAPLQGWKQDGGANGYGLLQHLFTATPDGQLAHYTESNLRAVIPPEGWNDYAKLWPAAQSVIDGLRAKAAAAVSQVKAGADAALGKVEAAIAPGSAAPPL